MRRQYHHVRMHRVGIQFNGQILTPPEWRGMLRKAIQSHSSSRWMLADLLNHGEDAGYSYPEAIAESGLSYQSLANLKWVSRRIALSRRRENLAFGHHAEVASLPEADQDRLLDLAQQNAWSREKLREEAAKARAALPATAPDDAVVDNPPKTLWLDVEITTIPLPARVPQATVAPLISPESKAVIDALELKRSHSPSQPLYWPPDRGCEQVTASASEREKLAGALRLLIAFDEQYAVLDAEATAHVRQAREAIERRLSATKTGAAAAEQRPAWPRLH